MAYQGHTPNALMNIQRHLKHQMQFCRTKNGNPYFRYKGKNIMYNKKKGFTIYGAKNQWKRSTNDFWTALELMR